jgi:hypothetical protein
VPYLIVARSKLLFQGINALRHILLALTAVAALSVAYPAKADMFKVSGTCTPGPGFTGTTFSGRLTIDVTTGTVTGINVSFQGLSPFTFIDNSFAAGTSNWEVLAFNAGINAGLNLEFTTGHTPGSLVGFTGGAIVGNAVNSTVINTIAGTDYTITGGSLTPAGVPDGGSTVSLLACALLGLAALRRKLGC